MSSSASFDTAYYLSNNADVVVAISQGHFANALDHYNQFGGKELRAPNATFNPSYYAINNSDVLNAVSSGVFANVFTHYQAFGEGENRAPSSAFASFDSAGYLEANADVAAAVTAGSFTSALDHFIQFGQAESRSGSGITETVDSNPGTNFTLTTGVDTNTGTSANDTFSGTIGNAEPTIGAGDSINGSGGTDTFHITSTGTTGTVAGVSLTNIETVRVSDTSTGATTVNLAGTTGVTSLESFGSAHTNTMSFTNVGALATLKLSNTSAAGAHTVTYGTAVVSGSSDTQNITLDTAANTGVTTIAGVETVAITASGSSNINLVAANATTATVNAADATTVTLSNAANTSLTSVTGSGAGGVTYVVDYNLSELSVTGGAGNDTIDVSANPLAALDSADGGEGTADKLLFQSTADITSVAAAAATISNIEVLELESDDDANAGAAADFTIDLDTTEGVTSVLLDANDTANAASFTLNDINATQMGAITTTLAGGGATIVLDAKDGSGTADAVTIGATMGTGAGTLTVTDSNNNIESLTITATGDANQTIAITAGDFTGSTSADATLSISGGSAGRTMTISNALSSDTVNLSGVASNTTATLATGIAHTFTGGTGNDTISMTTGFTSADTIDGGEGTDILSVTQTVTQSTAASVSNVETLRLGGTGTASLNLAGTTGLTNLDLEVSNGATGTNTLRGISTITTITIDADDNTAAQNDYQALTIANAYTGSADALTVDINSDATNGMNGTEGLITAGGIETLNVTLDGGEAVQFGGFTSAQLTGVTVSANSDFVAADTADLGTITGGTNNSILSYDSSGADIAVTSVVASLGNNAVVTLGSGADSFSTTGSTGTNITIDGGGGIDTITGAEGVEIINGGAGNDIIDGVGGGDTLNGDAGNDTITGDDGEADTINGGDGNDTMDGDGGLDTLTGGAGSDIFVFEDNAGDAAGDAITITDFSAGLGGDVIRIDIDTAANGVAALLANTIVNVANSAANRIIVDTAGTGYATVAAFETAVENANNNTSDFIGIFFNTTNNVVEMHADAASNTGGSSLLMASFSNITTDAAADTFLAALTSQNFDII